MSEPVRNLVVILGDQLDPDGTALEGFDPDRDAVLISEVEEEASYVPQHRQRLVLFFSAMRHLRDALESRGYEVFYGALDDRANRGTLASELERRVKACRPQRLIMTEPGDFRVLEQIRASAKRLEVALDVRRDGHFIDSIEDFAEYAKGRKRLVLEQYYRRLRKRHDILIRNGKPVQGRWNFDADNRERLPKDASSSIPAPLDRKSDGERRAIKSRADELKARFTSRTYL